MIFIIPFALKNINKQSGNICHFYIDEWQFVNKYKHDYVIKKIFAEPYGMSLVLIDDKSEGYIFNPVNSNLIKIPDLPSTIQGIVWETFEPEKVCLLIISQTFDSI